LLRNWTATMHADTALARSQSLDSGDKLLIQPPEEPDELLLAMRLHGNVR
jgi:hypothetical protein